MLDELKRLHGWATRSAVRCELSLTGGGLMLRTTGVHPPLSLDLTQAIAELVDERIAKTLQIRDAQTALATARGGPDTHE